MATQPIRMQRENKKRSWNEYENDDNDGIIYKTPNKRRRQIEQNYMYKNNNYTINDESYFIINHNQENQSFPCSYNPYHTNYKQQQSKPFKSNQTYSNHNKSSSSSSKPTKSFYFNPCSPFQPPYINTGLYKLNEFWQKMVGSKPTKNASKDSSFRPLSENKSNNRSKELLYGSTETQTLLNNIDFGDGIDSFDFHGLLKSLTAEFDRDEEMEEFNNLAKQIEKLNINLSSRQIQEIVDDENEMNDMIEKIKALDLNVIDKQFDDKLTVILKRLSELTINTKYGDEGEFDTVSDIESDDNQNHNDEYKCNYNQNTMQQRDDMDMIQQHNKWNDDDDDDDDVDVIKSELDDDDSLEVQKQCKLKNKSIVHKCAKFMLSMLMVGAPLLYYYVN